VIARAHSRITAVYEAAGGSAEMLDEAVLEQVRSYQARCEELQLWCAPAASEAVN
jgi:hypothetical protein